MNQTFQRVLVVDDNTDAVTSLAALLAATGYETKIACDGKTALANAHSFQPDIVLLDIGLPDMDGYTVARRLREEQQTRVVLIALTGYGQKEDIRRAQEAGFDHHLLKPVSLKDLRTLLNSS
jgi:CheY-like chemotaxis protein